MFIAAHIIFLNVISGTFQDKSLQCHAWMYKKGNMDNVLITAPSQTQTVHTYTFVRWDTIMCLCVCMCSVCGISLSRAKSVEFICSLPKHLHRGYDRLGKGFRAVPLWESRHINNPFWDGTLPFISGHSQPFSREFRKTETLMGWVLTCLDASNTINNNVLSQLCLASLLYSLLIPYKGYLYPKSLIHLKK